MKSYRKERWFNLPGRRAFINITPQVEDCLRGRAGPTASSLEPKATISSIGTTAAWCSTQMAAPRPSVKAANYACGCGPPSHPGLRTIDPLWEPAISPRKGDLACSRC